MAATVGAADAPTAVSAAASVTVGWEPASLSSGRPVDGYRILRYDAATMVAQSVVAGCAGVVSAMSCTESGVPDGRWVYTVTPLVGTYWTGSTSPASAPVTTDSTPPGNAITTTVVSGGAAQDGDSIYYRGAAAGSFTLTNAVADTGSGPASSTTTTLSGDASGWSHTASTVAEPSGGPYVSALFSWDAATAGGPSEHVLGADQAGNNVTTALAFINDSTAPSAGTISYPDGYQPERSVSVNFTTGADAGSGIVTRQLQRAEAELTAGTCGEFASFLDIAAADPTSPYLDSEVTDGFCYTYRYLVTDRTGNQAIATSGSEAKLDAAAGGLALASARSYSVLAGTGVVNTLGTTISGDLGVSPSSSITGFPPGIVAGTVNAGNAESAAALSDLAQAYTDAVGRGSDGEFAGDQNGQTFVAGTHHTAAAFGLTGVLTLDGRGDPNALFVFQIDGALNTAAASHLVLINGAQASHVFWQVNGAAGTGAASTFAGTILATGAITLGSGTLLIGRALSYGTVTLADNTIRFSSDPPPSMMIDGGAVLETKDTTPTVSGTTNAVPGAWVTVTAAGQTVTTTVQPDGTWSVIMASLSAGDYVVTATVRDAAGNAGSAIQTLTVEVNPATVLLNTASSYSVLTGMNVVGTGESVLSGDLGVSPGTSVTGFPPGLVNGTVHTGDAPAAQARSGFLDAYSDAAGRTPSREFTGDQNGKTFHEGVHHTAAAFALTGTLTFDAQGDPNAVFIIQVDAALNTAAASRVVLANGAQASHVFWQVAGAAGTGASSYFAGTIMAAGAVTLGAATRLTGQAMAGDTITLAGNTIAFN